MSVDRVFSRVQIAQRQHPNQASPPRRRRRRATTRPVGIPSSIPSGSGDSFLSFTLLSMLSQASQDHLWQVITYIFQPKFHCMYLNTFVNYRPTTTRRKDKMNFKFSHIGGSSYTWGSIRTRVLVIHIAPENEMRWPKEKTEGLPFSWAASFSARRPFFPTLPVNFIPSILYIVV